MGSASMDIEGILANQGDELLDVDLIGLKEELETGDYDSCYVERCSARIQSIQAAKSIAKRKASGFIGRPERDFAAPLVPGTMKVPPEELSPFGKSVEVSAPSAKEGFVRRLEVSRQDAKPLARFRELLSSERLDESFIDQNLVLFHPDERAVLLSCYDFSEAFLEKYFNAFDPVGIAKKQRFSEEFFMKHFDDLDASAALAHGVNDWRKKGARSPKLDVFLRLKGVRF